MNARDVTACIVTRGNVPLGPILDNLIFRRRVVWDNSRGDDLKTAGRYAAAELAETDVVYFQDDDVIVPAAAQRALLAAWEPGSYLANMEDDRNRDEYPELTWPGWGSLLERETYRRAFERWDGASDDYWFQIVGCDIIVSLLCGDARRDDFGREHLAYAYGADRAYLQDGFPTAKRAFYEAALKLRAAAC